MGKYRVLLLEGELVPKMHFKSTRVEEPHIFWTGKQPTMSRCEQSGSKGCKVKVELRRIEKGGERKEKLHTDPTYGGVKST